VTEPEEPFEPDDLTDVEGDADDADNGGERLPGVGRIEPVGLEVEMQRSYLDYAMSVISGWRSRGRCAIRSSTATATSARPATTPPPP
jgi:hypothetical protein